MRMQVLINFSLLPFLLDKIKLCHIAPLVEGTGRSDERAVGCGGGAKTVFAI